MRSQSRPGVTLIELLVSITLLMVVIGIGSLAARRTLAIDARLAVQASRGSSINDALRTLARHAANADPALGDIRVARDTMLDLVHGFGVTTVCHANLDTIVIASDDDSLPWHSALPRAVTADDAIRLWRDEEHVWAERRIRATLAASGACGDSVRTLPGRAAQRLVLSDTVSGVYVGAPVRVLQREKWSLVRGGDGTWALSLATWNSAVAGFHGPQPLIAPLAAPGAPGGAGFDALAIDAGNAILAGSALVNTRALIAVLRAPQHQRYGRVMDSVRINVGPH